MAWHFKENPKLVLCAPVAPVGGITFDPDTAPYSHYAQVDCPRCSKAMWVGERGAALVAEGAAEWLCMLCAFEIGTVEGPPPFKMGRLTDRDS
jgi:hypothetical protein